jgi:hypothetical protein
MILNTSGTVIDMTAQASQFGISTPVSVNMDNINIPDNLISTGVMIILAAIVGSVGLNIVGTKLFLKRRK